MTSRFGGCVGLSWLLGCAALLAPSVAEAQDQAQFLVADPIDFDFTPLVHSELAQASADSQPPGTDNQPVTVTPGESVASLTSVLLTCALLSPACHNSTSPIVTERIAGVSPCLITFSSFRMPLPSCLRLSGGRDIRPLYLKKVRGRRSLTQPLGRTYFWS